MHNYYQTRGLVAVVMVSAAIAVFLAVLIKLQTGAPPGFRLFYLAPVAVSAWLFGRVYGACVAVACTLALLSTPAPAGTVNGSTLMQLTDGSIVLSFFFVAAWWLSSVKKSIRNERRQARTDFTTGAVNKRRFHDLAAMEIKRFERYGRKFTVAVMDLDDFKAVNDRCGHRTGDRVLREVAQTMNANLRDTDAVARIGGDEFALLLPETDENEAFTVLAHMRRNLIARMQKHGFPVTFSIGAATFHHTPKDVNSILHLADELMYRAKRAGKNQTRLAVVLPDDADAEASGELAEPVEIGSPALALEYPAFGSGSEYRHEPMGIRVD